MTGNLYDTDTDLFALIAEGDEKAFERIFIRYTTILFPNLEKLLKSETDAREVIQEVFLNLWIDRKKLAAIENPGGWLRTMASYKAVDFVRSKVKYEARINRFGEMQPVDMEPGETFWAEWNAKETKEIIREAVTKLPLRRRQVFQMYKLEGYSRREIAEKLDLSENTVRNHIVSASEFIEEYLKGKKGLIAPISILILLLY